MKTVTLIDLILLALFGYVLHQFRSISENVPDGWQNIFDHTVGGIGILAAWPYVGWRMDLPTATIWRVELALVVILVGMGTGVFSGWVDDTLGNLIEKGSR